MITIKIDDRQVKSMLAAFPKQAQRAMEMAIDKVAVKGKDRVVGEMRKVFDNPTPFTLNSLKVTKTRNHNMTAIVGFKEPPRMQQHYLASEVLGGQRRDKGLEVALGKAAGQIVPAPGAKLNAYGNVPGQSVKKIIAALKGESKSSNREFIYLPKGSGSRPPGIYQRVKSGKGVWGAARKALPDGSLERGRVRGKFGSSANYAVADARAIKGRRLLAVMFKGKNLVYKERLPFWGIVEQVVDSEFPALFSAEFAKVMGHV